MPLKYYKTTIKDPRTPFAHSFRNGTKCDLRIGDGDIIIWNGDGIRYISEFQSTHYLKDREEATDPQQEESSLDDLRSRILASDRGLLLDPYPVTHRPHKGFPEEWNGHEVIVADNSPFVHPEYNDPEWWADWWITEELKTQVYVQTMIAYAIMDMRSSLRKYEVDDTHEHEVGEASDSLEGVPTLYPQAKRSQMGGLAQQLGGIMHAKQKDVTAAGGEGPYNRQFDIDLRRLGIQ
jgi:hypothetical protein